MLITSAAMEDSNVVSPLMTAEMEDSNVVSPLMTVEMEDSGESRGFYVYFNKEYRSR